MGGWSDDDIPEDEQSKLASDNAAKLSERLVELIGEAVARPTSLLLGAETICELNRLTVAGLADGAGQFRSRDVEIIGSRHDPPPSADVGPLVGAMCAQVNRREDDPLTASAFVMWRIAWIHPFGAGNGRTSRAAGYLVLGSALGRVLPGVRTILEQLWDEKRAYYRALEAADKAWARGHTDVSTLRAMIDRMLRKQLAGK